MVRKLFSKITNIDKSIFKIIKKIFVVSLILSTISCLILSMYIYYPVSHITYLAGIQLFKSSLLIAVFGFISGFSVDLLRS